MGDQVDFTNLPDLRDKYPGKTLVYRQILSIQSPATYDGGDESTWSAQDMNGIDVLICVIRELYTHIRRDCDGDKTRSSPEIGSKIRDEYEKMNPLLRLAWSYLKRKGHGIEAQNSARTKIAKQMLESGGAADLSFKELVESPIMHRTLFCRPSFLLFDRTVLSQPLPENPAPNQDAPGQVDDNWDAQDAWADPVAMAKASLVTWDGQGDLSRAIMAKFGFFTSPRVGRAYFWAANRGAMIRVLYNAPLENPKTYEHLKELKVDDLNLTPSNASRSEYIWAPPLESYKYVLIVAVRLRAAPGESDLLRRWGSDGKYLFEEMDWAFSNDEWRLGEPGRQYYLFYALTGAKAPRTSLPEILYRPPRHEETTNLHFNSVERAVAIAKSGGTEEPQAMLGHYPVTRLS